jgi:flotillin
MEVLMNPNVLFIIIGAVLFCICPFLFLFLLSALFIRRTGPNQVMIVYGAGGTKVIVGGSHIILPRFQQAKYFSLEVMPFQVELTQEIYLAEQKTYVNVEATVLIKVRTEADEPDVALVIEQLRSKNQLTRAELLRALSVTDMRESMLRAVELFLDKSETARAELIRIVVEGHLRSLIGQRTFEELVKEPEALTEGMFRIMRGDLDRMGLEMVSFTVQGISRHSSAL